MNQRGKTNTQTVITSSRICQCAVMAAVVYVITRFVQIPIPLGYFNVGNAFILTTCAMMPSPYGIIVGSMGSALADLTSYPIYTIPTLLIKALMPIIFYWFISGKTWKNHKWIYLAGAAVSTLIPLFGYTLTGGIIAGSMQAGLAQFPGLLIEYIANLVLFEVLITVIAKNHRSVELTDDFH